MNEREALLRAVCENPDDDTPRLVFADWLDEHDEPERAEFIRVQIKLACGSDEPRLKQREQELLTAHRAAWSEPFRQFNPADRSRHFFYGVQFRRGFVHAITLNDEEKRFVGNAPALFQLAPIERVNLFGTYQHGEISRCPEMLRVKELMLDRGDGFETGALAALVRSKYLVNLVRLDLIADDDNGHLAPDGLEVLSRAKSLPGLRYLDVSFNYEWTYSEERNTWVRLLLKGNLIGQLETLRLGSTDVGDEGAQILARCKRVGSLTHLDLSGNSISPVGLRALARSRTLTRLKTLDLRGNHYDPDDIQVRECPPELRSLLETRFGTGVLLDGKPDPHPHDVLFAEFK